MTSIDDIKRTVCDHYGITMADLMGPRRVRSLSRPRQVAMTLARELTEKSAPQVGRAFSRDHTTVLHAGRAVVSRLLLEPGFYDEWDSLRVACTVNAPVFRHYRGAEQ